MSTITQQIEEILDKRLGRGEYSGHGRLQKIEARIAALESVKENVEQLDALVSTVHKQIEEKQGAYFNMLSSDPEALAQFDDVSCVNSKLKLNEAIAELKKLKLRFEREALRIAFIGYERQGKSTFLQSMTGLSNEVIPAYDGTSCTGAVSIIHNSNSPFMVEIEFCTAAEFIDNLKSKLKGLFPDKNFVINSIEDIRKIDISDYSGEDALEVKKMIGNNIVKHLDDYKDYLGMGKKKFYKENEVMEFVAQYREYDSLPEGEDSNDFEQRIKSKDVNGVPIKIVYRKRYYKYLAVKSVNIYCPFLHQDCGKIEFVDTIGLGASVNPEGIEREMFRVLREDCDAAVDVFCPAPTGGALNKFQKDIFKKINEQLSSRNPRLWMAYAINGIPSGEKANIQNIPDIMTELDDMGDSLPFGIYKEVNAANREDVNNNLLIPLLSLITENLDSLDEAMMNKVEVISKEAYNECLSLIKSANAVTSASAGYNADALSLFDEKLFKELLKSFGYAMNQIDQKGYATKRDTECFQLEQAYSNIINEIDVYIPDEEVILEQFETGALVTQNQMFEEYVEQMRNDIFTAFEDVNSKVLHPLQEKVKIDLIEILFNQGLLKNLPTSHETASIDWLKEVIDNYVDEAKYPNLRKALQFILDYQINIEGLVEYNVTKSLYILDKTHSEFIPYKGEFTEDFEQKASDVWQELCNRLTPVQNRLRDWISSFTLIPSHSFYSRVHKFHVKVMTDADGKEDFRRFYRKNMGLIWAGEINAAGKTQKAFGDWTERVKNLQQVVTSDNFKLN